MSQYQEQHYQNENIENGYYDESNYQQPSNVGGSVNYDQSENYAPGEDVAWDKNSKREEYMRMRQEKYEATKADFELWDSQKQWRPFTILPRDWWRAAPPNHSAPLLHPVNLVILTYSHGRTCKNTYFCTHEAKRMQMSHQKNGAVDIVYNFMIGGNGQVMEGRGWHSSPRLAHRLQRFARNALHIGFLGNLKDVMPSDVMFQAAADLMAFGVEKKFIAPKFLEYSTRLWSMTSPALGSEVLTALENC